jgi:hypothetical protein
MTVTRIKSVLIYWRRRQHKRSKREDSTSGRHEGEAMTHLKLTLSDGRTFLIRGDLVLQVRSREDGADVWFPTGVVMVKESIDEIRNMLEGRANLCGESN